MITGWRGLALAIAITISSVGFLAAGAMVGGPAGTGGANGGEARQQAALLPAPTIGPDGMFVEAWYRPSSGDLARDAQAAGEEGKIMVIFWERVGCPYCYLLHTQALRIPALHDYVSNKLYVVRLDFVGEKPVTDFDGQTVPEAEIAIRHRVPGTPTFEFRAADGKEVLRIPGYIEPPMLQLAFEFVETGAYKQTNINAWLRDRGVL